MQSESSPRRAAQDVVWVPSERRPNAAGYPGVKPELLELASSVFVQPHERVDLANQDNWWHPGFRCVVHAPDDDV